MAIVTALCKCFVGDALRNKGDSFEYNGKENENLQGVRKRAKKKVSHDDGADEKNIAGDTDSNSVADGAGSDDIFNNGADDNV